MSEIQNNTPLAEDDEISLIDLFAVLIKHRFMIILGTSIVAVLCIFYLFVLPNVYEKANKHSVTIEYNYHINSLSNALAQELGFSDQKQNVIVSLTKYNLTNLPFISEEIKKYNPFQDDFEKMTSYEYNRYIQNIVNKKAIDTEISPMNTDLTIKITVPENNISVANEMIADIINGTTAEMEAYIFPKLDAIEKSINDSLSGSDSNQKMLETQSLIRNFKTSYTGFLTSSGEPFILLEPLGRLKKLIIITFAAFFIFVFIAFLLNAIDNIKEDAEASDKIKTAWDGGKISRKK